MRLPSGEIVPNGMTFRNNYHLRAQATCFVPCGGRPEAVDISNVGSLIIDGKSKFAYIVEGANLYPHPSFFTNVSFITQDAKLRLEKAGAIVYKDASANKGGVTSSSLEGTFLGNLIADFSACFPVLQRHRIRRTYVRKRRRDTTLLLALRPKRPTRNRVQRTSRIRSNLARTRSYQETPLCPLRRIVPRNHQT